MKKWFLLVCCLSLCIWNQAFANHWLVKNNEPSFWSCELQKDGQSNKPPKIISFSYDARLKVAVAAFNTIEDDWDDADEGTWDKFYKESVLSLHKLNFTILGNNNNWFENERTASSTKQLTIEASPDQLPDLLERLIAVDGDFAAIMPLFENAKVSAWTDGEGGNEVVTARHDGAENAAVLLATRAIEIQTSSVQQQDQSVTAKPLTRSVEVQTDSIVALASQDNSMETKVHVPACRSSGSFTPLVGVKMAAPTPSKTLVTLTPQDLLGKGAMAASTAMQDLNSRSSKLSWSGCQFSSADASQWRQHGIPVEDAYKWRQHGIPVKDAYKWRGFGFPVEDAYKWRGAGFSVEDAYKWRQHAFTSENAYQWSKAGFDTEKAYQRRQRGFTPNQ